MLPVFFLVLLVIATTNGCHCPAGMYCDFCYPSCDSDPSQGPCWTQGISGFTSCVTCLFPATVAPAPAPGCLAGDDVVETQRGLVRISDLKVGALVKTLSADGSGVAYSSVWFDLHRPNNATQWFVELTTQGGRSLRATKKHLMLVSDCAGTGSLRSAFAEAVQPGDCLLAEDGPGGPLRPSPVVTVRDVELSGTYAPLTNTGTIVVNGVVTSCYPVIPDHERAHKFFSFFRRYLPKQAKGALLSTFSGMTNTQRLMWLDSVAEAMVKYDDFGPNPSAGALCAGPASKLAEATEHYMFDA